MIVSGGKHRSRFFHENWCLKYLPKFKWEDLQEGIGIVLACCVSTCNTLISCVRVRFIPSHNNGCSSDIKSILGFDAEYQKHLFQHRLQAELSQAKKDQEFYLSKVNQAQQAEKAEKSVEDVPEDDIVAQEDKVEKYHKNIIQANQLFVFPK